MAERRLIPLAALLGIVTLAYMTLGANGNWGFVLPYRGAKLVALLLVGVAISTSTVLFQTITRNRILTPSIMGFDALYVLLLTGVVYGFGGQAYLDLPPPVLFLFNVVLLVGASLALFGTLLGRAQGDLMRMILTGIIFGTLFSSVTGFFQRLIDPNEFAIVQVASYARFTRIETDLLALSTLLVAACLSAAWGLRHRLDVLALGPKAAINLGVDPRRGQMAALALIAVLVSVSTALVGPVVFLGLLVVSLAHLVTPSAHHGVILPSAALIAGIVLVGGQTVMERVLDLKTPLSVVVDFVGGLVFLMLLLKGLRR